MKLRQFSAFIDEIYAPISAAKNPEAPAGAGVKVPVIFAVKRDGAIDVTAVTVIVTSRTGLTFFSNGF